MSAGQHRMRVGFPGDPHTIVVKLPRGDIEPWDLDTKYKIVGTDQSRVDGLAKVTGQANFTADQNPKGLLFGVLYRSPIARGRLKSLDLDAARKMPGVKAVVALKKPGNRLRHAGDDVAAIAATSLDAARDALDKVRAEFDKERHNTDIRNARRAPRMDGDRVTERWPKMFAEELEAALDALKIVREATYTTEVQVHCSLEPHGMVAMWKGDDLEVWSSTQANHHTPVALKQTLKAMFGIEASDVRCHADFVGGGFGSKFPPGAEAVAAALLARHAKAPVKVMCDRFEELTCTGNRPSAIVQIRAGVDRKGKLRVWDYRSWGGPGHVGRGGATHAPTYGDRLTKRRTRHVDLPTDTDAARPMRAPGRPQGYFAAESMMDELAIACDMDPLEFRLANDPDKLRHAEWRLAAERFAWKDRRRTTPIDAKQRLLRGAGLSSALWGGQGSPGRPNYQVTCRILRDGTAEVRNAAQDIGTGMKTVMAMLVAEELGIPIARVRAVLGDSHDPAGPASGGSTTTPSLAPAVRHAAALAKQKLIALAGGKKLSFVEMAKLVPETGLEATGRRFPNYHGYLDHVCGCQFAEVEVDRHTGLVQVTKMLAVQDCGLVIAKKLAESQVLGAMTQGLGYALHEQRILDHRKGRMLNGDMLAYKIAGTADMPEMEAIMLSVANGRNNVGACGLGEPPAVATAAAIANAVRNAIGAPVRSLPITPDRVLAALGKGS